MRSRLAIVAILLVTACKGSTDLSKVKRVYARWERGWQEAKSCMFGKVERTVDLKLQMQLAILLEERPQCPSWLLNEDETLPPYSVSQLGEKEHDKELDDRGNAINLWLLLQPEDLTDELAADIEELTATVKALHKLTMKTNDKRQIEAITKVVEARQHLRDHLGLPEEGARVGIATPVMLLTLTAPPPPPPAITDRTLAGKWKIVAQGKHYTITDGTSTTVLPDDAELTSDIKNWSRPQAIDDTTEPIVWIVRNQEHADRELRVYQLIGGAWNETRHANVAYLGIAPRRLDILWRSTPATDANEPLVTPNANYLWVTPGKHDVRFSRLLNLGTIGWLCSSENFLWMTSDKNEASLVRFRPIVAQNAETVPASFGSGQCEDNTVYNAYNGLCTLGGGCKPAIAGEFLDGQTVSVHAGPPSDDGQLLVMKTSTRKEKIFRLPPGVTFGSFTIRDHKPVVRIAGAAPTLGDARSSAGPEPTDYQCGGDGQVVPRIGCRCPEGARPARTVANVAICEPTGGARPAPSSGPTATSAQGPKATEAVLPWPI